MSELHLLDILAARHGCFISDLNLSPILRRAALLDLCRMDENSYPLSQWQDTVRYLTGDERDFASVKEIQAFIKQDSFSVYNGVQVLRAVDRLLKQHEATTTGRRRLVLVHGNRFLLNRILEKIKCADGFDDTYLSNERINDLVTEHFQEQWDGVFSAMETKFPDAYPAYIFRNVGRLKELVDVTP